MQTHDTQYTHMTAQALRGGQYARLTTSKGDRLVIRPIRADDAWEMYDLFPTLSEHTVYMRFLRAMSQPDMATVSRFANVNTDKVLGIVVLLEEEDGPRMVGTGRLIRNKAGDKVAELSCLVLDAYQGRGIGPALVNQLLLWGQDWGLERAIALVHGENRSMLKLLKRTDYPTDFELDYGEYVINMDLRQQDAMTA